MDAIAFDRGNRVEPVPDILSALDEPIDVDRQNGRHRRPKARG
jgi:hypothetical protein